MDPIFSSAFTVAVKFDESSRPSRLTTTKPGSVNVTIVASPGPDRRSCTGPFSSVTTRRATFSISAGLAGFDGHAGQRQTGRVLDHAHETGSRPRLCCRYGRSGQEEDDSERVQSRVQRPLHVRHVCFLVHPVRHVWRTLLRRAQREGHRVVEECSFDSSSDIRFESSIDSCNQSPRRGPCPTLRSQE